MYRQKLAIADSTATLWECSSEDSPDHTPTGEHYFPAWFLQFFCLHSYISMGAKKVVCIWGNDQCTFIVNAKRKIEASVLNTVIFRVLQSQKDSHQFRHLYFITRLLIFLEKAWRLSQELWLKAIPKLQDKCTIIPYFRCPKSTFSNIFLQFIYYKLYLKT